MIGNQYGSGILHLGDEFQDRVGAFVFQDAGNLVPGCTFGKLGRNGIEQEGDSSFSLF